MNKEKVTFVDDLGNKEEQYVEADIYEQSQIKERRITLTLPRSVSFEFMQTETNRESEELALVESKEIIKEVDKEFRFKVGDVVFDSPDLVNPFDYLRLYENQLKQDQKEKKMRLFSKAFFTFFFSFSSAFVFFVYYFFGSSAEFFIYFPIFFSCVIFSCLFYLSYWLETKSGDI